MARVMVVDDEASVRSALRRIVERTPDRDLVKLGLAEGLPEVYADPDLMGQVFANLIRNAVEAGADRIEIRTERNGEKVEARVRNSGPAIPPEILGRLFQPFVTTKAKGAGLGLALCKKIVTAHGGEIKVSNVDRGAEFEVRLPCRS